MTTIYMTPFLPGDPPIATGPAADSGMATFDDVRAMMGEPLPVSTAGVLIYDDGTGGRLAFCRVPLGDK